MVIDSSLHLAAANVSSNLSLTWEHQNRFKCFNEFEIKWYDTDGNNDGWSCSCSDSLCSIVSFCSLVSNCPSWLNCSMKAHTWRKQISDRLLTMASNNFCQTFAELLLRPACLMRSIIGHASRTAQGHSHRPQSQKGQVELGIRLSICVDQANSVPEIQSIYFTISKRHPRPGVLILRRPCCLH